MTTKDTSSQPPVWEQRWHPLREEWVLFTAHRNGRPWVGELKRPDSTAAPSYDATCALCPGNPRIHGVNPAYTGAYWFTNDLPCFGPDAPQPSDHDKTLAELSVDEVRAVVGTSNPHPHCQIYAGGLVYGHIGREVESGRRHLARTGEFLGQAILARELADPRVVAANGSFVACVPWFARYAYEVLVLPRRQVSSLSDLDSDERRGLAEMLREVAILYDSLWRMPMPYVMAVHQAPSDGQDHATFSFHVEFHPPLRTPDTLKYLAGPEVGGGSMTNETDPDAMVKSLRRRGPEQGFFGARVSGGGCGGTVAVLLAADALPALRRLAAETTGTAVIC